MSEKPAGQSRQEEAREERDGGDQQRGLHVHEGDLRSPGVLDLGDGDADEPGARERERRGRGRATFSPRIGRQRDDEVLPARPDPAKNSRTRGRTTTRLYSIAPSHAALVPRCTRKSRPRRGRAPSTTSSAFGRTRTACRAGCVDREPLLDRGSPGGRASSPACRGPEAPAPRRPPEGVRAGDDVHGSAALVELRPHGEHALERP